MASRLLRHLLPKSRQLPVLGLLTPRRGHVVHQDLLQRPRPVWHTLVRRVGSITSDVLWSCDRTWLRENCQCSECFNRETKQRNVLFYKMAPGQLDIADLRVDEGQGARITWRDGHVTDYPLDWLSENLNAGISGNYGNTERVLWDSAIMATSCIDQVPYSTFMTKTDGLKRLLRSVLVYGIGMVTGVDPTAEHTQKVTDKISHIQQTFFGGMCTINSDNIWADTAYSTIALGAHTDSTYLSHASGLQIFHCLEHTGQGGETLLVDGFRAAEQLRQSDPEAFSMLCQYRIHHQYKDREIDMRCLHPILTAHPISGEMEAIRYNHNDRCPITTVPQSDMPAYYAALAGLSRRMTDPKSEYWIKLKPGTVLFLDNWRVLHGRAAFTGLRRLCSCYLPRDDWMSRARVLGL